MKKKKKKKKHKTKKTKKNTEKISYIFLKKNIFLYFGMTTDTLSSPKSKKQKQNTLKRNLSHSGVNAEI